ncbi:MAG TPA: SDR family NAD(P)-dependent oxidoreductase [Pseudonocardiaceae bacterium]|nr:SDR family NAD(P)-dependent oxidoreductase [Pseudonocardiaceae bacterium]
MPTRSEQRIIVTGAASGIGLGISELFVDRGSRVLMFDVDTDALGAAAGKLGASAVPFTGDVSDVSAWQSAIGTARSEWGGVDALVNNAGVDYVAPFVEHDEATFDRLIAINLRGTFLGMKYGATAIAESGGGAIVNIASIAGMQSSASGHAAYSASKAGVIALTKTGAIELGNIGVRANAICPGMIKTPLLDSSGQQMEALTGNSFEAWINQTQGRMGYPFDIAALVAFLASDEASLITGAVIPVDGGVTSRLL